MKSTQEGSFIIFISSTFSDLIDYRKAVCDAILSLRHHASDMIHWSADERDPTTLSMDELEASDLIILLLAHRYGTIPSGETRSITEIEYDRAQELKKPVIAFFIDPEHEWPGSKFDWKSYDRLSRFKEKVEQSCTPKLFTTASSLAASVTQAVANFDKRRSTFSWASREWTPLLVVDKSATIEQKADIFVPIGDAEDGLPQILEITRPDNLTRLLREIAVLLGTEEDGSSNARLNTYFKGILQEGEQIRRNRGIHSIDEQNDVFRCYVTSPTLLDILQGSLFSFLLPSPMIDPTRLQAREMRYPGTLIAAPAAYFSRETLGTDIRIQSLGGRNRFLALGLNEPRFLVVGQSATSESGFCVWHDFFSESLNGFSEWNYVLSAGDRDEILDEGDCSTYVHSLTQHFEQRMDLNGTADVRTEFQISRLAIANSIIQILEIMQEEFHNKGLVHGDVKPPNFLMTIQGPKLIDSLNLTIGEISPALSPLWAAPEQLAIRPVRTATDIYPIGLALVALLGGQLTGEIIRYQLPLEVSCTIVSMIRNPLIYLSRDEPTIPDEGRNSWLQFLERCLRYEPEHRFLNGCDCAIALKQLIETYPPLGNLSIDLPRGHLQMARMPNGQNKVCRILPENRSNRRLASNEYQWLGHRTG